MKRKALHGHTPTINGSVQQNTKIVLCGTYKEVGWILRRLRTIFEDKPLNSIKRDEFAEAMHIVNVLKQLHAERRRHD